MTTMLDGGGGGKQTRQTCRGRLQITVPSLSPSIIHSIRSKVSIIIINIINLFEQVAKFSSLEDSGECLPIEAKF